MKKTIITAFSCLAFFTLCTFVACTPDPCEQVNCAYSGFCEDGTCICQTGYEGVHCETITREKFKGIYNVNEDGTLTSIAQYTTSIEDGDVINEVRIKNFQNFFVNDVIATVAGDVMTISPQVVDGYEVQGTATIVGTNPLNQHYYQHALMDFYYSVRNTTNNNINEFGSGGSAPSVWSK